MATLIAGAGKGIGFELVKLNLQNYPKEKTIAVSRNVKQLLALKAKGKNLIIIRADISSNEGIRSITNQLKSKKISIRFIVNLAAVLVKKNWKNFTENDFKTVYANNVFGAFNLIKNTFPFIEKKNKSHILNIGSMGGVTGTQKFPGMLVYSSSKAALSCLTECLAEELKKQKIHVNCIALGAVETEMKRKAFPGFKAPHTAKEAAGFILFFLRNLRSFFNGKVIEASVSVP